MTNQALGGLVLFVWPLAVVLAYAELARVSSSYFTCNGIAACAAVVHIPIFFAWVANTIKAGSRWPIVLSFVLFQALIVPLSLKMILLG